MPCRQADAFAQPDPAACWINHTRSDEARTYRRKDQFRDALASGNSARQESTAPGLRPRRHHGPGTPRSAPVGRHMYFLLIFCRVFHLLWRSVLTASRKDILPTAPFRLQRMRRRIVAGSDYLTEHTYGQQATSDARVAAAPVVRHPDRTEATRPADLRGCRKKQPQHKTACFAPPTAAA